MNDISRSVWVAVISAILTAILAAGGSTFVSSQINNSNQEKLLQSTDKLSDAVTELRITVGIQNEKFVTKEQLAIRLKEFKEEMN